MTDIAIGDTILYRGLVHYVSYVRIDHHVNFIGFEISCLETLVGGEAFPYEQTWGSMTCLVCIALRGSET